MPESTAERTEKPTYRKLQKARFRGHVPQSQELTSVVTLLILIVMIAALMIFGAAAVIAGNGQEKAKLGP